MSWILLLFGLILLTSIEVSNAVKLTNLKVATTYIIEDKDNPEPLILDCEYEVGQNETGLVVKWLLNDNQIYQWIPSHRPYPLGYMKTKIDTTFSSINNEFHLPMTIVKPEVNMTGNYTCSVQTFQSNDKKSAHLQIIVAESDFQLNAKVENGDSDVDITCRVQDVYPQPILSLVFNDEKPLKLAPLVEKDENGLYDVTVSTKVPRKGIESPLSINCILSLPETNYTKRRETIFYDEEITTTMGTNIEEDSRAISRLEGEVHNAGNIVRFNHNSISLLIGRILVVCLAAAIS